MKKTCFAALAVILGLISAIPARAAVVFIDSNDNVLAPDGYYTLLYPNHFQASEFRDGRGNKGADADLRVDLLFVRVIGYKHVGKLPLVFQVIVPFGRIDESKFLNARSSGIGDVIFGPGAFLYTNDTSSTYLSYWLYASAPTGDFDGTRPVNLGAHHWFLEHQLAFNQTLFKKVVFDTNVNFYHHTEEGETRVKAPLRFEFASCLGYQLTDKFLAGLHGGAYWDLGDAEIAGIAAPDTKARKVAVGPMLSYQWTEKLATTFRYTRDLSAANDFLGNDFWLRASYAL
jgi:hypothetical protein